MTAVLDARLNAFRTDLADDRLKGVVDAERYLAGKPATIDVPVADILRTPSPDSSISTQFLLGDRVRVFDRADGWAWVQGERDGYVGYVAEADLAMGREKPATHRVIVPRTFVYPEPELKTRPLRTLSIGSGVAVEAEEDRRGNRYAVLADGSALVAAHLDRHASDAGDYVAVAELLLRTPYLWGGASAFGIDCSGLVQTLFGLHGVTLPRDSWQQQKHNIISKDSDKKETTSGAPLEPDGDYAGLHRGDLVFWKGHVGIMTDGENFLHANGRTMTVALEPLKSAIARIEPLYGLPTSVRRP